MASEEGPRPFKYNIVFKNYLRITAEEMLFAAISCMIFGILILALVSNVTFGGLLIVKLVVGLYGCFAVISLCIALYFIGLLIFLRESDNGILSCKWLWCPRMLLPIELDPVELGDDSTWISRIGNRLGTGWAAYVGSPKTTNPRHSAPGTPRNSPRPDTSRQMVSHQMPRTSTDTSHGIESLPWDSESLSSPQSKLTSGEFHEISLGSHSCRNKDFRSRSETSTGSGGEAADIGEESSTVGADEYRFDSFELFFTLAPDQSHHIVACKKSAAAEFRPVEADMGHSPASREQSEVEQEPDVICKNVPESSAADIGGELSTVPESSHFDVDEDGSESLELFFPPQSRHSVGCKKRAAAKSRPVEADSGHSLASLEQSEVEQEPDVISKNIPESSPVSTESSRILSSPEKSEGEQESDAVICKNADVPESSLVSTESSLSSRNEVFRPRLDPSTGSSGAADIGGELSTVPESSHVDVDEDGSESLELFFPPHSRHFVGCKKPAAAKSRPFEADSGHSLASREQSEVEQEPDVICKNVPESSPVSTESSRILSSPEKSEGEKESDAVICKNADVLESSPVSTESSLIPSSPEQSGGGHVPSAICEISNVRESSVSAESSQKPLHPEIIGDSQVSDVVISKEPDSSGSLHVFSGIKQKPAKHGQSSAFIIPAIIISGEPGEPVYRYNAADYEKEHESEKSVDVKFQDISEEPGSEDRPYNLEALKTETEETLHFSTEQLADSFLPVEKRQKSEVIGRDSAFHETAAEEVSTLKGGCVPSEQCLPKTAIRENPDPNSEDLEQLRSTMFHSDPSLLSDAKPTELPSAPGEMQILGSRTESPNLPTTRSEPLELASKIEKSSGSVEEEGNISDASE